MYAEFVSARRVGVQESIQVAAAGNGCNKAQCEGEVYFAAVDREGLQSYWCRQCARVTLPASLLTLAMHGETGNEPSPSGIEAMVCRDIAERQSHGLAKYGVGVIDNPLLLREWLQRAYEEALDNAIYLRRAIHAIDTGDLRPPEKPVT